MALIVSVIAFAQALSEYITPSPSTAIITPGSMRTSPMFTGLLNGSETNT